MFLQSRVFRRYFISYLIILIIPSIAGYMSYSTSISVMTRASVENSVTQLQKSKEMLEQRLAEVEGFTRQLAINQELGTLMNERGTSEKPNVYGIWKMLEDVTALGQTNDFLEHYFIYLKNYNVVLTPGSAFVRPEHYYDIYHYADLPFEEWRQLLETTHRSEIMPMRAFESGTRTLPVITYMQTLPLDSFNDSSPAVVMVIIDERKISGLLSGITERYGGWVHVGDSDGRTISLQGIHLEDLEALTNDRRFDVAQTSQFLGDDLVITVRSEANGWIYQAGIPREVLMENANHIKRITWTVTGAALLLGLIVGLLLSYRHSAPIQRILGVLGQEDESGGRNEYDFLHGNIAEMLTKNKKMELELRRQQPLIRDAFYKRLIAGEFQSREEIVASAVQSAAGIIGSSGYVAIIHIVGYSGVSSVEVLNELSATRLILKQSVSELTGDVAMTDTGSDKIVALFVSEEGDIAPYDQPRIERVLGRLAESLYREYKISIVAAVSERFDTLTDISQAFEQAKQALEFAAQSEHKPVAWFSDTRLESVTYYYPLDIELRLIGKIKVGELEEARRILSSIVTQNTEQRDLSYEMKNQLILELKGTLLKLLDQKTFMESENFEGVKERIIGIQGTESLERIRDEIYTIMEALCGMVASRKNDMHVQLVERTKQYIGEHYSDPDLTLYRIAEQVERPEKSISQLFKDVTGVNLSEHLEQVRLEQAIALLKTGFTIDEIASRVGYNSSHSFRRAFKRVMGVSPSDYRQSIEGA